MNKYDLVLGIEIHIQTKTKTKMFSPSKNIYNDLPNTNINAIDLGYPGSKPLVNIKAVKHAIRLSDALNMDISNKIVFDRKHYFYPDLPKGFQITQFYYPIGKNGTLKLLNGKKIGITQLHMEEDTAKQIHDNGTSYIDYNRAGVPLIEIVTDHKSIHTIEDAMLFVKTLRSLLLYYGISNAKMNEGSMRCDINISLKPKGSKELGSKVEIKNINSISNIKLAIEKEVEIQTKTLNNKEKVIQATKHFDDKKIQVITMREKESTIDYLYFRETNIPTILISNEEIKNILQDKLHFNDFILDFSNRLKIDLNKVMDFINKPSFSIFLQVYEESIDLKVAYNLFESVIANIINKIGYVPNISKNDILKLIIARTKKELTQTQIGELFEKISIKKVDLDQEIKKINESKINVSEIENILDKIMKHNNEIVSQYNKRPERVEKFLMGQLMKETKGNINPSDAMIIIQKKINNKGIIK